jgi:hypothetical protein
MLQCLDTSTTAVPEKAEPLLWLDTLCCPAERGAAKDKAIEGLRNVYERADRVLVLDSSLFSISTSDLHPSEMAIRAYTSPWMRRLWTLQGMRLRTAVSVSELQ